MLRITIEKHEEQIERQRENEDGRMTEEQREGEEKWMKIEEQKAKN